MIASAGWLRPWPARPKIFMADRLLP
jgi:hypothetical protein